MIFSYEGLVAQAIERGRRLGLRKALFHLVNFPDFLGNTIATASSRRDGRFETTVGGWTLTVDNLQETKALRDELRLDGGYAITHVGQIRRTDGASFTSASAVRISDDIGYALSFARGGFSHPLLLVGSDTAGAWVWERWDDNVQSPFTYRMSWLDPMVRNTLPALIPGFVARCQDPVWREPIRRATILYVEANQHPRVEVGIVLAQTGLELLAWALLVIDKKVVTRATFDFVWDAAERIRRLLGMVGVPVAVPPSYRALASLSGPAAAADGPQRVAFVRNRVVHPPKRVSGSWPATPAVGEAERLSLEYLELALLSLSGFRGSYWSRARGSTIPVPWP